MSKATNAVIAALKAKFETGDIPDGPDFAQLVQLIQNAVQEHEHASGGGVSSGTGDAAQVAYPGDLKDLFFDWPLSPMLVDGGTIETGTNANSVKVGSLTAILRKTNAEDGILVKVTKAAEDNIVLTNPDIIYRVVLQYNSGTPAIVLQAAEPNRTTDISIGKCIRDSAGNVHLINAGYRLSNGLAKLHRRAAQLRKLELAIGCVIEHTGTRNFTIGEGHVYGGINEFNPFEAGDFASLTDKFTLVYNDGSWQYVTDQTAIPNDKYNDYGVGLANLGNNKYGCFWIYLHPDDEHVYVLYGTDTYTLTEALLANPPSNVPGLLADFGVMLGCIVVKEGAALFASIQMVTDVVFAGVEAADHGGLGGLSDDDHPQYMVKDTPQLGGDLDLNGHVILGQITGVEWNQGADTWMRIDKYGGAISLTHADFDDFYPWAGMRRVNLAVDGEINAIYGDDAYKEDGTNGRVMVQIPRFWIRSEKIVESGATKYRWWISDHAASGFEVHPAFNQRTASVPADYIYVAAYEASLMDDAGTVKFDSKSAEQPFTGSSIAKIDFASGQNEPAVGDTVSCADSGATAVIVDYHKVSGAWGSDAAGSLYLKHPGDATLSWLTAKLLTNDTQASEALATSNGASAELHLDIEEARTYAENVGSYWGILNIWSLAAVQLLFMIEYGNMDSQTGIGRGVVDKDDGIGFAGELTAAASINSNLGDNGTGAGTGTNGLVPIAYRWIENPWGNVWKFIDGYEAVDAAYRILKATGGWTNSGPSIWGSGDYDASTAVPTQTDNYIGNIVYEAVLKYLLIGDGTPGSTSEYIPDYFYAHDAGEVNILLASGRWNNGSSVGLGCLRSPNVASYSGRHLGCRLEFIG